MSYSQVRRIGEGLTHRLWWLMPDKLYLRLLFGFHMGKRLNLRDPKTFNEKLQWLKLFDRRDCYTEMVDKISAKAYAERKIGKEHIIPTYCVWETPDEIDLEVLPESFVLKCNHSGGNSSVFVVKDKSQFDLEAARKGLAHTMKGSIYRAFREWPYKNVKPRILAEKMLATDIDDYKFFCFNGSVESVMACYDRGTGDTKFYFFDRNWQLQRYNVRGKNAPEGFTAPKPKNVEKMFEIASKLSEGIPFVRVDLYNVDGEIYFGEMTFYPASGLDQNILKEADEMFGNLIKLPQKSVK